ncbi:MAG: helix-hairpin-helix domain-containing protein [Anaerolineae bacterium]
MNDQQSSSPLITIIAFVILVAGIIIGGALLVLSRPQPTEIVINPPLPTATPAPTQLPAPVTIYVTGAVNQPQTSVQVPFGSRVDTVLEAVGGLTDDADLDRVNLAGIVRDGDQVHVPSVNTISSTANDSALPTPAGGDMIAINRATAEELQQLPGIGAVTAQNIIDYRDANGAFTSLEDLDNVSGIGPSTLETLAPLIVFD